jgi:deoxyribose-phosphate aldolase
MQEKKNIILQLISCIDLTSLNNTDNEPSIQQLINKANQGFDGIYPAAVCTFSNFGEQVKSSLRSNIRTAVVGSCFPNGQTLSTAKIEEARHISKTGIDELDIVINRGDALIGNEENIFNEIQAIKKAIGHIQLKVILETGELKEEKLIKKISQIAIGAGADFIKTSTGKSVTGASPEAVRWMCEIIQSHYKNTGKKIGIKPSGGIRTFEDAHEYYSIVQSILGNDWLNPNLFRIGASSLYDQLIQEYKKL